MTRRLSLALECCGLLAVPVLSFDACLIAFRKASLASTTVLNIPVLVATVIIFLLIMFHKELTGGKTVHFPLNFTLPALFVTLSWGVASLLTHTESSASAASFNIAPMRLWLQFDILALVLVCQIAALTISIHFQKSVEPSLP